jgi:hypothetical protein
MKRLCILAAAVMISAPSAVAPASPTTSSGTASPTALPGTAQLSEPAPLEVYLGDGRFRLLADFETAADTGNAVPRPLTADTAAFWFFRPDNLELMVKLLDACPLDQRFWVFAAGLTDVGVELTVEDTVAGVSRPYANQRGTPFAPVQDTAAFATCDRQRQCGRGTAGEIAAGPREDFSVEWLALAAGRRLTAAAHYDRIVADLAAIRTLAPETEELEFVGRWDPNTVIVEFERSVYDAIDAGTYHAWDCLNDWYRVTGVIAFSGPTQESGFVGVVFDAPLHPYLVGPDYATLPGALGFMPDVLVPPPIPTIPQPSSLPLLCARLGGQRLHYYFKSGAMGWYAVSPAPGQLPTAVEDFNLSLPTIPPAWVDEIEECRRSHAFYY